MNWCKEHPRYSAKREPNSLCGRCFELWFLKNPESKAGLQREWQAWKQEMESKL